MYYSGNIFNQTSFTVPNSGLLFINWFSQLYFHFSFNWLHPYGHLSFYDHELWPTIVTVWTWTCIAKVMTLESFCVNTQRDRHTHTGIIPLTDCPTWPLKWSLRSVITLPAGDIALLQLVADHKCTTRGVQGTVLAIAVTLSAPSCMCTCRHITNK